MEYRSQEPGARRESPGDAAARDPPFDTTARKLAITQGFGVHDADIGSLVAGACLLAPGSLILHLQIDHVLEWLTGREAADVFAEEVEHPAAGMR